MDMVNGSGGTATDYQGFWDRFILIPSSEVCILSCYDKVSAIVISQRLDTKISLNNACKRSAHISFQPQSKKQI